MIDNPLGLVFGWSAICLENGRPYYDRQGEYLPEDVLLRSAAAYMRGGRPAKIKHAGDDIGTTVFAFPLITEIAAALGIETSRTGLIVGVKPDSRELLQAVIDGEYPAFSFGGLATREEVP